jgi:hypothetical protein
MKSILFSIGIVLVYPSLFYGQSRKVVTDYIAYNCEQFQYDLVRSENGLYSLKVINLNSLFSSSPKIKLKVDSLRVFKDSIVVLSQAFKVSKEDSSCIKIFNDYIDSLILAKRLMIKSQDTLYTYSKRIDTIAKIKYFVRKIMSMVDTSKSEKAPVTIPFNSLNQEPFTFILKKLILNEASVNSLTPCLLKGDDLEQVVLDNFFSSRNKMNLVDEEPTTAKFTLLPGDIKYRFFKNQNIDSISFKKYGVRLRAENASLEFEDGTIKNLSITCDLLDTFGNKIHPHSFIFKNKIPISISSRSDKDNLETIPLYYYEIAPFVKSLKIDSALRYHYPKNMLKCNWFKKENQIRYGTSKIDYVIISLGDVIRMEDILEANKEDYSPVNGTAFMSKEKPIAELRKEKTSAIIDLRAFSDMEGFKEGSPNGLLQLEGSKKINGWTYRFGDTKFYFGFGTYIEPKLRVSKIEGQNNELVIQPPSTLTLRSNQQTISIRYLDLTKYQKYSVELNGNILRFYMPFIKCNVQLNYLASIYNTTVRNLNPIDSILKTITYSPSNINLFADKSSQVNSVNCFRHGIKALIEFKPEPRYAFSLGLEVAKNSLLTEGIQIDPSDHKWISNYLIQGFIRTKADNSIFFRYRLSNYNSNLKDGFTQAQIGYKTDIFSKAK